MGKFSVNNFVINSVIPKSQLIRLDFQFVFTKLANYIFKKSH